MSRYYPPVTVTGNPVNFSAPNGGKLDSVSVQIIPTQDLHGYANPWPGGGGKNKLPPTIAETKSENGLSCASDGNGNFTFSGTLSGTFNKTFTDIGTAYVIQSGDYLHCLNSVASSSVLMYLYFTDNTSVYATLSTTNKIQSLSGHEGKTVKAIRFYVGAQYNATVSPMIVNASTSTAFEPWENICPISGITGLSVYVSPTQDPDDATLYNEDWSAQAGTVYHGTVDVVSGELTVDMVNIPSYNGETITEPWLSSMDAYAAGTTPTIGAQVVYTLADPAVYQLGHKFLTVLSGENYVWASNNETISVVYALLVPGSGKYTLIVNGVDIADFVERDSYRTTLYPVFSEAVQTLDGVGHTALLRKKGELSARFNPRTAADTAIICAALLNAPCEVQYHCLQRNADVTALMTIDSVSALYLSRCLYCGQKWNDIDSITLTEL